jgi:molybdenum cofactor cytidylyltransferase
MKPRIAAIVLAAGLGTRMGGDKMLANLKGKALIAHAVQNLPTSELAQIVVVTGEDDSAIRAALADYSPLYVRNPDPAAGMGTSIACGAKAVRDEIDAVLICLGDMPLVRPATITALIAAFAAEPAIWLPVHGGQRGHPVLFPASYLPQLVQLSGDQGARTILAAAPVQQIETSDPGILIDIDTPAALAQLNERRDSADAATIAFSTAGG